jgi:molybdopterin-guanine dinucleotide biosynthesis protein A
LPADLYVRMLERAAGGAALAVTADGRQPLCSLWPVAALPAVRDALAGGAHPPTWQLLERLGARKVVFDDAAAFANVNTRADLEGAERATAQARRP